VKFQSIFNRGKKKSKIGVAGLVESCVVTSTNRSVKRKLEFGRSIGATVKDEKISKISKI
jgi:hypothetical protein